MPASSRIPAEPDAGVTKKALGDRPGIRILWPQPQLSRQERGLVLVFALVGLIFLGALYAFEREELPPALLAGLAGAIAVGIALQAAFWLQRIDAVVLDDTRLTVYKRVGPIRWRVDSTPVSDIADLIVGHSRVELHHRHGRARVVESDGVRVVRRQGPAIDFDHGADRRELETIIGWLRTELASSGRLQPADEADWQQADVPAPPGHRIQLSQNAQGLVVAMPAAPNRLLHLAAIALVPGLPLALMQAFAVMRGLEAEMASIFEGLSVILAAGLGLLYWLLTRPRDYEQLELRAGRLLYHRKYLGGLRLHTLPLGAVTTVTTGRGTLILTAPGFQTLTLGRGLQPAEREWLHGVLRQSLAAVRGVTSGESP